MRASVQDASTYRAIAIVNGFVFVAIELIRMRFRDAPPPTEIACGSCLRINLQVALFAIAQASAW